jgi:glycogen(starch) synthase
MRVLFWAPGFLPEIGGIEVLAAKLLPTMRERGYEYLVITSRSNSSLPEHAIYEDIPIHRFPFWQSLVNVDEIVKVKRRVAKLMRRFAPDLVHLNSVGRDSFFYLITANAHLAPLLITLHGEWVSQADDVVRSTLRCANWVAGCSKAILEKGRGLAPEITDYSSIVYNAVAEPVIPIEPLPFQAPRLLCLGRLSKEKGFDLALAAFASVVKRFPHAHLVVAGDGPEQQSLAAQAAQAGLDGAVEFVGWVSPDHVFALMNQATLIVIPSRLESLPVVALQAAQMSRPVVGTRVGGLPELVIDQHTGLLVDEENPEALANAIKFLLEHPGQAVQMGQAARNRVQRKFNWKRHVDSYDMLYRRLTNSS